MVMRTLTRAVTVMMMVVGALTGAPAAVADDVTPAPVVGVVAEAPAEAPEGPGQTAPTGGTGDAAEAPTGPTGPAGDVAGDLADDAPAPDPAPVPEAPAEAPEGPGDGDVAGGTGDAPQAAEGPAEAPTGDADDVGTGSDPLPGEPGQLTPYAPGPGGRTRISEILPACQDAQDSGCYDAATGGGRWVGPDGSRAYTWDDGRLLVLGPDGTSAPASDGGGYWVLRSDGTLYRVPSYADGEAIEAAQCEAAVAAGVLPAGSCDAAEGAEGADDGDGDAVRDEGPAQVVTGGLPARMADTGASGGLVVLAAELAAGGLALVWLVRRSR